MNPETLCVSCMEDDSGSPVCPKCGAPFQLPVSNTLLLPPRTLLRDQYLIGRALGHGGFGITYLAWDTGLQTRLAVKEYLPTGVAGRSDGIQVAPFSQQAKEEYEWGLERFLDEARVLKRLNHNNIVSVDTMFRANGTAYLVMEYLEGTNFEEFLRRRGGTLPTDEALRLMMPVMDALIAVHAEDILHRDVSPDNIYILKTGKVKLIDFGAARNSLSQKSRRSSVILKAGYAPEEQYRTSGKLGPWCDVYATAATLYRALTGKVPPGSLDRQAGDTLESPSALGVRISPAAESALMKALAVRSAERFQSMAEFKSALAVPSQHVPPPAPAPQPVSRLEAAIQKYEAQAPPPVVREPDTRRKARKWLMPAIVAGLVVAAAAGGWLYFHKRSPAASSLTEWPGQPPGIPQPDEERQRALESQNQPPQATPVVPAPAPEPAQPIPSRPAPAPKATQPPPSAPAPAAAEVHAPPPAPAQLAAPPPPPPTPSYGDLLKQADNMLAAKQYTQAQALLNQAIQANSARPQAYNALAKLELYLLNLPSQAFEHYRAAIAKGGVATLRVTHEKGAGWLSISQANAAYQGDGGADSFDSGAVKEAKKNKSGLLKGGKGHFAFHIKLVTGQNYNFEPTSQSPGPEVDFILSVLGG